MISIVEVSERSPAKNECIFLDKLDCYRKKQRGDCHSIEFQRAAAERAQFIYNDHHPDQPAPLSNPRPPVHHDFLRHPSWTLRQLEREYLTRQHDRTQLTQVSVDEQ